MLQQLQYSQAISTHFPTDIRMPPPQGGYFLWVELPETVDRLALFQSAIRHNLSLAQGHTFSSKQAFALYTRLNVGHGGHGQSTGITDIGQTHHAACSPN